MRYKYAILCLILLASALCITAVAAEEASLGDYTFTIPEYFEVTNETDDALYLESDDMRTITVTKIDGKLDAKEIFKRLEPQGFKFSARADETYKEGDFNVSRYTVDYKTYTGYAYICENNEDMFLINHVAIGEDISEYQSDNDDVDCIIGSLKKN